MQFQQLVRTARLKSSLSLRVLADRAGTSHSTIAAYEAGRKVPSVETLDRILAAAGFVAETTLRRRFSDSPELGLSRGDELAAVLTLAGEFPVRHEPEMTYPVFGR